MIFFIHWLWLVVFLALAVWAPICGFIELIQYPPLSFWPSVSIEKSGVIQISLTLYATWPFSYIAFNILSLFWTFIILNMYHKEFPFWSYRGQKQWGRKRFISACSCRLAWREKEVEAEAMEECCLLVCSTCLAQTVFLYKNQWLINITALSELGSLIPITNQEYAPQAYL